MANIAPTHRFHRWLQACRAYEQTWRQNCETWCDYYDGTQWTDDEQAVIEGRGQQATVLNVIRPTVDMVLSLEKERRVDFQIVGREESDDTVAMILTELHKQVCDTNDFDYWLSCVFEDCVRVGRGWMKWEPYKDEEKHWQVRVDHVPWNEMYIDPFHRRPDGSDARYIIRCKWTDRDAVKRKWKDKADEVDSVFNDDYRDLESEAQTAAADRGRGLLYYEHGSQRIALYECWYRDPDGKIRYCVFSDSVFFEGSEDGQNENPYKVDSCYPFMCCYAFRDRKGLPQGLVKLLKDLQDMLNKENSKLIWNMAANRLMLEEGAVLDAEEARTEWARPNGIVLLEPNGLAKVKTEDNLRESQHLMAHMQFILGMLQRTSGVNDSMTGLGGPNERSAVQQSQRITQGTQVQNKLIENIYMCRKSAARTTLRFIGAYYDDERVIRVTQPNGTSEYFKLNPQEQMPDGTTVNRKDIESILRYDVIFKPVQPFTVQRQVMAQLFTEVSKSEPNAFPPAFVGQVLLDMSDLPNRKTLIYQLQQHTAAMQAAAAQGAALQQQGAV